MTAFPEPAFFPALVGMAQRLGGPPLDHLQVMFAEGGAKSDAKNPFSDASGLIQIMPFNLPGVGWHGTPEEFRQLTELQQLPYVERYYAKWTQFGLTHLGRIYQAVFLPGTLSLGSADDTVIAGRNGPNSAAYASNSTVDHGNKGAITVGDLKLAVLERCNGQRWEQLKAALATAISGVTAPTVPVPPATGGLRPDHPGLLYYMAPNVTKLSPNVNRDAAGNPVTMPATCKTVIIHCTRSGRIPMNPSEFEGTLNYMSTAGTTSSQLVGARDGRLARVVPDTQQSWHAGEDNDNAWGYELEQAVESDGFEAAQIATLVRACRGYVAMGVPIRHARNSTEGGFIGHEETAQGKASGKSDPGRLFDWDAFLAMLMAPEVSMPDGVKQGLAQEGQYQILYNNDFGGLRFGSTDGHFPFRISKAFGDPNLPDGDPNKGEWIWLRRGSPLPAPAGIRNYAAVWSTEEGD